MKRVILLNLLIITNVVFSQTTINTVLKDFSILKVYNGIDLELVKADELRIEISGNKANKTVVKQDGNILKISLRFPETLAEGNVRATLYYKDEIEVIDANEGATITGKNIEQQALEVKAQEGAFINLVIETKHLKVKSTSGAVIKLSGLAKNQTVNVDLGATYHGYNVRVSNVSTIKSGSGAKAEVSVGETLDAKVSFGGTIFYKGTPEIFNERKVIGGTIEQRN